MMDALHEDRFVDRAPAAVYATLLEEGRYLCSIRTMYRVLHSAGEVLERRRQRRHPHRDPPQLVATAPNQVWTWDITRVAGPRKWVTYPLYVVLDLFSRYVVAWMVAARESATRAKRLIRNACQKQGIQAGQLTRHQDRGAPMTAKTFSQLLIDLDILASYSRPRTSDDNPYSESHFKTVEIRAHVPGMFRRSPGSAVVFPVFLPVVQHPTSPQRDRPADAGRRALRPRQRNPGSASTRTQRCLHTAPRALRQRTASATASSWRSVDQSTAEHYRMRTNSSVNLHARCLIRLDTVRHVNGLRFQFDLSLDRNIKKMYLHCYEIEVASVINRVLKKGDVFVDVGANIGYLAAYAAGVVGTSGQVHAFEPVPEYFERLRSVSDENPDYDIKVHQCAVGEQSGDEEIAVTSRRNIGFNTMVPGIIGSERTSYSVSVPVVRLDDYISKNISRNITLVKIDVEGFESLVLKGLSSYFPNADPLPVIVCEIIANTYPIFDLSLQMVWDYMGENGYRALDIVDMKSPLDIAQLPRTSAIDVVFVPADSSDSS